MQKKYIVLLVVVAFLVILRFALEPIVEHYVNRTLNDMEGYSGSISDVDINLYRGAYQIDGLQLFVVDNHVEEPLLSIDTIDLSVQWKSLLDGALVGEVILSQPVVNFVAAYNDSDTTQGQTGEDIAWHEQLKNYMPLTLNRFEIKRGRITYRDPTMSPSVDARAQQLDLVATNLSNVEDTSYLPATLRATAVTIGGGEMNLDMQADFLRDIPNLRADFKLDRVDLTQLNDFIKAYANFDVQQGTLTLVSEVTIDSSQISGYVKPFFENLDVFDFKEDVVEDRGFFGKLWEALVGVGAEVLENQSRDEVATKVPIEGNLSNPTPNISATVVNVLRNAFVDAIEKEFDRQASLVPSKDAQGK